MDGSQMIADNINGPADVSSRSKGNGSDPIVANTSQNDSEDVKLIENDIKIAEEVVISTSCNESPADSSVLPSNSCGKSMDNDTIPPDTNTSTPADTNTTIPPDTNTIIRPDASTTIPPDATDTAESGDIISDNGTLNLSCTESASQCTGVAVASSEATHTEVDTSTAPVVITNQSESKTSDPEHGASMLNILSELSVMFDAKEHKTVSGSSNVVLVTPSKRIITPVCRKWKPLAKSPLKTPGTEFSQILYRHLHIPSM